jgi:ABC-type bacteriocin/lantibiotic exporter with double-glycine peptidase domain
MPTSQWQRGWAALTRRFSCLIVILGLAQAVSAQTPEPEETTTLDCGVNALFVLLQLQGRPVTLESVLSALPPRRPAGYSMAELSATARSLGLGLDGVKFVKGDEPLTQPAIAFLHDAKGGILPYSGL